jgi:uncharacterized membrane protein
MHFVTAMKHKKYQIRVVSNSKGDMWFVLGFLLAIAAIAVLILVLIEAPVIHKPW